jgi:hypothetical protein
MRTILSAERELFILHSSEQRDARFVPTYLVPSLGLLRHQLLLSSSLPPGRPVLDALETPWPLERLVMNLVQDAAKERSR